MAPKTEREREFLWKQVKKQFPQHWSVSQGLWYTTRPGSDCHVCHLCVCVILYFSHSNNDSLMERRHFLKHSFDSCQTLYGVNYPRISHEEISRSNLRLLSQWAWPQSRMMSPGALTVRQSNQVYWIITETRKVTQPPRTTAWRLKQGIGGHCGIKKRQSNDCFQSGVTWKQALTDQGRFCFVVGFQQRVMGRGGHGGGEGSKLEQSHTSQDNLTRAIKQFSSLTTTHTRTRAGVNSRSRHN